MLHRVRIAVFVSLSAFSSAWAQKSCTVSNLWVNGNFEDASMSCYVFNLANRISNNNAPWSGFAMFRWQPLSQVQPTYLNEATIDHTLNTKHGHYLYIDPREQSGWNFQFYQKFKVEKSTWYNFSMWYCSMNKPGNPGATIRLAVNNVAVSSSVTIANKNDAWVQIKGSWFSGTDTIATAALETLDAQVHGHDFAIDDVLFGNGNLIADAGPDQTFCSLDSVTLNANIGAQIGSLCRNFNYEWQPAFLINGNNISSSVKLNSPITSGKYWVIVTDLNGEQCVDTMNVELDASSIIPKQKDTSLCPGDSVVITIPNSITTFKWSDGYLNHKRTLKKAGIYIIQYSDKCLKGNDTFIISLDSIPSGFLPQDTTFCDSVELKVKVPASWKSSKWWDGLNGTDRTLKGEGIYIINYEGKCGNVSDSIRINRIPDDYRLQLANVFTPGSDGFNDFYRVPLKNYSKFDIRIFNRWGEKVFHSRDPQYSWNGKVENAGPELPSGTYFYILRVEQVPCWKSSKEITGCITLIRK